MVHHESQATFKIFKVKYEAQADLRIFKVKRTWRRRAGARRGRAGRQTGEVSGCGRGTPFIAPALPQCEGQPRRSACFAG